MWATFVLVLAGLGVAAAPVHGQGDPADPIPPPPEGGEDPAPFPRFFEIVYEDKVARRNLVQSALQLLEVNVEEARRDRLLEMLLKLSTYDWSDLEGWAVAIDAIMSDAEALGYARPDFAAPEQIEAVFRTVFSGYDEARMTLDQLRYQHEHVRRTYEDVLLTVNVEASRIAAHADRLRRHRRRLLDASPLAALEVRGQARIEQLERMLSLRHALMGRALLRSVDLSADADARARSQLVLETAMRGQ